MSPPHLQLHVSGKDFEIIVYKKLQVILENGFNLLHVQLKGIEELTTAA